VAVLAFSGGAGIVSTDFIEENGLQLAELSPATRSALGELFPAWMPVANPVDLWPALERHIGTPVDVFGCSLSAVLEDPNVDAVLLHAYVGNSRIGMDLPDLSARICKAGKPVFFWLLGPRDEAHQLQKEALSLGIPIFGEISRAVDCLAAALRIRRCPEPAIDGRGATPVLTPVLRQLLSTASGPLDEHLSKELLRAFGIPTVKEEIVAGAAEAEEAASGIGYPVVLKGLLPGGVHKTELGLVRMGLQDGKAVRQALEDLRARMEARGGGQVLLQRQVRGKVELILGLLRDPQFGPCVMFGLGGVTAEILDDTAFAVAPLTRREALDLVGRIRGQKMLDGFRGAPPVDREEIAGILCALGELGLAFPRIREIDINPLIVTAGGAVAVDATLVIA
jgi:acetyltransferase